jgi:hypothetical protein
LRKPSRCWVFLLALGGGVAPIGHTSVTRATTRRARRRGKRLCAGLSRGSAHRQPRWGPRCRCGFCARGVPEAAPTRRGRAIGLAKRIGGGESQVCCSHRGLPASRSGSRSQHGCSCPDGSPVPGGVRRSQIASARTRSTAQLPAEAPVRRVSTIEARSNLEGCVHFRAMAEERLAGNVTRMPPRLVAPLAFAGLPRAA